MIDTYQNTRSKTKKSNTGLNLPDEEKEKKHHNIHGLTRDPSMELVPSKSWSEGSNTDRHDNSNFIQRSRSHNFMNMRSTQQDEDLEYSSLLLNTKRKNFHDANSQKILRRHCITITSIFVFLALILTIGSLSFMNHADKGNDGAIAVTPTTTIKMMSSEHLRDLTQNKLSDLAPSDLTFPNYEDRPMFSSPNPNLFLDMGVSSESNGESATNLKPKPTNAWYMNLLLYGDAGITKANSVNTLPYIIDAATSSSTTGIRIHYPYQNANSQVVQSVYDETFGLTLGCASSSTSSSIYNLVEGSTTELGLILNYDLGKMTENSESTMKFPIVRGMPYATAIYSFLSSEVNPTIISQHPLKSTPKIDGQQLNICNNNAVPIEVKKEIQLHFEASDFTWIVFLSRPSTISCVTGGKDGQFQLMVHNVEDDYSDLVVRVALLDECTSLNGGGVYCSRRTQNNDKESMMEKKVELLRQGADLYPYKPQVQLMYQNDEKISEGNNEAIIQFDWGVRSMMNSSNDSHYNSSSSSALLMYALPHHLEQVMNIQNNETSSVCLNTLRGNICLLQTTTSKWEMSLPRSQLQQVQNLFTKSFVSPHGPPNPSAIPKIVEALQNDIQFQIPDYYLRGVGDTYFSGKMLAKLARIIKIYQEMDILCSYDSKSVQQLLYYNNNDGKDKGSYFSTNNNNIQDAVKACHKVQHQLPTKTQVDQAIEQLRKGVEVWLNGKAQSLFVYDSKWGGLVSCGCYFNHGNCDNSYPNCPSFSDPGLNFGHGFYNDHHFHQGYHIYAAAVLSSIDHDWAIDYYEHVKVLIRDIANPSDSDSFFPKFRHKDWFLGSSWASGIATIGGGVPFPNGRNQESSSECVAAYEAIGLYGAVMADIFASPTDGDVKDDLHDDQREKNWQTAQDIHQLGVILTATEISAAQRYWHDSKNDIYPENYSANVVGIVWSTMIQFQTWFGNAPFLVYGIQMLPLTVMSESLFDLQWLQQVYEPFSDSCNQNCVDDGWSIPILAAMASLGHLEEAIQKAQDTLTDKTFKTAAGNGHSMTNTLWYLSTRPALEKPLSLKKKKSSDNGQQQHNPSNNHHHQHTIVDSKNGCGLCSKDFCDKSRCPDDAPYICSQGPALNGCSKVPWTLNPLSCTVCCSCGNDDDQEDITQTTTAANKNVDDTDTACKSCTSEICSNHSCNIESAPYLCTDGPAKDGCARNPWQIVNEVCHECCILTHGCEKEDNESVAKDDDEQQQNEDQHIEESCPLCTPEVCSSQMNQCNSSFNPFLCIKGAAVGGCSGTVWKLGSACTECCKLIC